MPNIRSLPEEVMQMIIKQIDSETLVGCAYVCKSWYLPSIVSLLSFVDLVTPSQVESFIAFIDKNPIPLYTNAVDTVCIDPYKDIFIDRELYYLDDTHISKLFLRFPNLTRIFIGETVSIKNIRSDTCKTIKEHCPKINVFSLSFNDESISEESYRFRSLLTDVFASGFIYGPPRRLSMDIVKFLCSFPRLVSNEDFYGDELVSFLQVLRVVEKLPYLHKVVMGEVQDDDNFAVKFLRRRNKNTQRLIVGRLARIDELEVRGLSSIISANSVDFISRFMVGVRTFLFEADDNPNWSSEVREHYYGDVLMGILRRCKSYYLKLQFTKLKDLSECFAATVNKIFVKNKQHKRKHTIYFSVRDDDGHYFKVNFKDHFIEMSIKVNDQVPFSEIASTLFADCQIFYVDEFHIDFSSVKNSYATDLSSYNTIMKSMPLLEKLDIDRLNNKFTEGTDISYEDDDMMLPNLKEIKINTSSSDVNLQPLFNKYSIVSPSLKRLDIHNWGGLWDPDIGEFQIKLPNCSLLHLFFDASPIVKKTLECLGKQGLSTERFFFVLEVETLNRYVRKHRVVSFNNGALSLNTSIDNGLIGHTLGKDFFRLKIIVHSLQRLEFFYYAGPPLTTSTVKFNIPYM